MRLRDKTPEEIEQEAEAALPPVSPTAPTPVDPSPEPGSTAKKGATKESAGAKKPVTVTPPKGAKPAAPAKGDAKGEKGESAAAAAAAAAATAAAAAPKPSRHPSTFQLSVQFSPLGGEVQAGGPAGLKGGDLDSTA
ncbi:MAG: hypothetical protein WDW36_008748 [Sanguina aurantia]